jgi:hypothetical protein
MRRTLIVATIASTITFAGVAASSPPALDQFRLTLNGLGPLRIGMTLKDVEDAGFRVKIEHNFDVNECAQAEVEGQKHIWLMFENGRLARVEVYGGRTTTFSGVRVGDTEERVRKTYGARLTVEPHKYDDNGHYLIVFSTDRRQALVMETDGKVVTEFRAGLALPAQYVEGCL